MDQTGAAPFIAAAAVSIVVFGCLCGAIGQSKGQSAGGWFVVGALLGIIGLFLVLFVRAPVPPPQPPGWYPDPWGQFAWRWWDGYQWTWQTPEAQQ